MNLKQHTFVTEYLRRGDQVMAYMHAYNRFDANYKTIESASNRLLKKPEIAQAIHDAQTRVREQVEQELAQELKDQVLTIEHKRQLLFKIATGEMVVEQNYKGKNCTQCTQFIHPSINQMLKAIDIDNKLTHQYPKNLYTFPVVTKQTATEEKNIQKHNKTQQIITTQQLPPSDTMTPHQIKTILTQPMPRNDNKHIQQNSS